jgi:hypothetical protein
MDPQQQFEAGHAEAQQGTTLIADTPQAPAPITEVTNVNSANAPQQEYEVFTAEDIARVREQEKSKVYPQIDRLREELAELKREKEEREAEEARLRAEAEADAKRKAEEEMEVRDLLAKKEEEFAAQLEAERLERERAFALLETEKRFQELQSYKTQRLDQERDNIIPELLDLVEGSSQEEIDRSIENLRDRSNRILESAQQAMQSARRDMAGSRVTAPASGPLDTDPDNRPYTPDDIRGMSMADYMKNRSRLLGESAASRGRGLFG